MEGRRDGSLDCFFRHTAFSRPLNRSGCPLQVSRVVTARVRRERPRAMVKGGGPNLVREECKRVHFEDVRGESHVTIWLGEHVDG